MLVIFWGANRQKNKNEEKREARFLFQDASVGIVSFEKVVVVQKFE